MPELIFVYGTLLPELRPRGMTIGRGWRSLGAGSLPGALYDAGPYPCGVLDAGEGARIRGHVFELSDEAAGSLDSLDAYEGYDEDDEPRSLFVRRRTNVDVDDGRKMRCWVWVYNRGTGRMPRVPHGDYLAWKSRLGLLG